MADTEDEVLYRQLLPEWQAVLSATAGTSRQRDVRTAAEWGRLVVMYSAQVKMLRAKGDWLGGHRTLLHAVGRQHDELALTAGLGWLLDQDGHHRLGRLLLDELLRRLELAHDPHLPVTVTLEETRADTRADLVLRTPMHTVLFEAKVWAGEQDRQLDRLAELWSDDSPTLVFLTRQRRPSVTAHRSHEQWKPLLWRDIAAMIRVCIAEKPHVAPGVLDYCHTLESFHP